MRILDVGQRAEGVIAIGQEATGFFALGQIATGVIAIGQLARGVIAIGQLSIGLVSVGMLSFGLIHAIGLGAGGRSGLGAVLPLVPAPPKRAQLPDRTAIDAIVASGQPGWVDVLIRSVGSGVELVHAGTVLAASIAPTLLAGAITHARMGGHAVAHVVPSREGLRVTRLIANPNVARSFNPIFAAIQIVLLAILAGVYWEVVLVPLGDFLVRVLRDVAAGVIS